MSLRARVLGVSLVGLVMVCGVAGGLRVPLGMAFAFPWVTAAIFLGVMTLATALVGRHPFPTFGPANIVTTARVGLLALLGGLLVGPPGARAAEMAVSAAVASAVLDGVDGRLARRSRMASAYGARFDMETDAAIILVLSLLAWRGGKAGAWVITGGLLRYGFEAAGWVWPWMHAPLSPTFRAKCIAIAHLVGLTVALAPFVPWPYSAAAAGLTLGALVWSFAVDVGRLRAGRAL